MAGQKFQPSIVCLTAIISFLGIKKMARGGNPLGPLDALFVASVILCHKQSSFISAFWQG
jgi:hypothetical protein